MFDNNLQMFWVTRCESPMAFAIHPNSPNYPHLSQTLKVQSWILDIHSRTHMTSKAAKLTIPAPFLLHRAWGPLSGLDGPVPLCKTSDFDLFCNPTWIFPRSFRVRLISAFSTEKSGCFLDGFFFWVGEGVDVFGYAGYAKMHTAILKIEACRCGATGWTWWRKKGASLPGVDA